jgi:hypothetical protein
MGGGSVAQAPNIANGGANFGNGITSTSSGGNTTYNNPWATQQMQTDQQGITSALNNVNVLNPTTMANLGQQAQAVENNGLQTLNQNYNNGVNSAMSNVNQRFGGINNSGMAQETNDINHNYALGQANLANQYTGNMQNLENNQLSQQYQYLNALQNNYGQNWNQALQAMGQANQNNSMYNGQLNTQFANQNTQNANQNTQNQQMYKDVGAFTGAVLGAS